MNASAGTPLRKRIVDVIEKQMPPGQSSIDPTMSLLRSGRVDSLALFNLMLLVEEEIGRPVRLAQFDLAKEWDTVLDIEQFIARQRGAASVTTDSADPKCDQPRAKAINCKVGLFSPEMLPQIASLQKLLWSNDESTNVAYFDWKYRRNPYQSEPLVYVALVDGEVAGMRGFCGAWWEAGRPIGSQPILYADDLVVAPRFRNSGIISAIMDKALDDLRQRGHHRIVNLSAGALTYLQSLASGWKSAGWVRELRRRSPWTARRQRARSVFAKLPLLWRLSGALGAQTFPRGSSNRSSRLTIAEEPRCADMAALVGRCSATGRIRHARDETFLSWRFANPLRRYRFFYWDDRHLEGYLVLQRGLAIGEDHETLRIVDFEATSDTARDELLSAALRASRFRDLVIWAASLPPAWVDALESAGFREPSDGNSDARRRPAVLVKALGDLPDDDLRFEGRCLDRIGDWDVRMLFSMQG